MGMINIYVVHADAEARLAQELYGFLLPQVRSGRLALSGRFRMAASTDAALAEAEGIAAADVVVLLVSQRLLIDRDEAIQLAMVRSRLQRAPVIPVLVNKANLRGSALSGLVALPREAPGLVANFPDRDSAWVDVADGILAVVDELPRRAREVAAAALDEGPARLLFTVASPTDTSRLQVNREINQLRARLLQLGVAGRLALVDKRDVDLGELASALLSQRPRALHFSGHSQGDGSLLFLGLRDQASAVSAAALQQLFTGLPQRPRILVLNTCFAGRQLGALSGAAEVCIGHLGAISDADAVLFTDLLYQRLALGASVRAAFALAQAALVGRTQSVLQAAPGVDPERVVLVEAGDAGASAA